MIQPNCGHSPRLTSRNLKPFLHSWTRRRHSFENCCPEYVANPYPQTGSKLKGQTSAHCPLLLFGGMNGGFGNGLGLKFGFGKLSWGNGIWGAAVTETAEK